MRKLTVFIKGDSKGVQLDESILVTGNNHLLVKTVTVFWNYNVFTGYNDHVMGSHGSVTLTEGCWTFQMLVDSLKEENINLEASKANGKCSILHNDLLFLGRLGELLGFLANTAIQANTKTESPNEVELTAASAL